MIPTKEFVKFIALGLMLLFLLSACGPDEAALEATVVAQADADIVETIAAQPTVTIQPTYTAEPTQTTQPTHTAEPTLTSLPTLTPEATYTPLPTYIPQPTYTPQPTNTPLPVNTPVPVATTSPTQQFTVEGVLLTMGYMRGILSTYGRCTITSSTSGCISYDYGLDCVQFVNNYNAIVARKNLAPQNAEEPIRTAAAIYTQAVQTYIDEMAPQVAYCQEQINLGRTEIDSREIGDKRYDQQSEALNQLEQVVNILRQVEEQSGNE